MCTPFRGQNMRSREERRRKGRERKKNKTKKKGEEYGRKNFLKS